MLATVAGVAVAAIGLSVVIALGSGADDATTNDVAATTVEQIPEIQEVSQAASAETYESIVSTETPDVVEVPDLIGRPLIEVQVVAEAAGIAIDVVEDSSVAPTVDGDTRLVLAQEPAVGEMVFVGGVVVVTVAPSATPAASLADVVVCIDPGHQSHSDTSQEPVGPGSHETKDRVSGGTTGTTTFIPEYEITLQIALNLKAHLEEAGITVVMTREANDVNISNGERAVMANEAGAALFVRIHGDGSPNPDASGISILYPAVNQWTEPISSASADAAARIQSAMIASTGAVDRGIVPRDDITGFNWAEVPAILVECGFMTNPVEDKLLSSPHYQDKLAMGMTSGILDFVGR